MNKVILTVIVALLIGLSSCSKVVNNCYDCTKTTTRIETVWENDLFNSEVGAGHYVQKEVKYRTTEIICGASNSDISVIESEGTHGNTITNCNKR